jgi:hypothetical protein
MLSIPTPIAKFRRPMVIQEVEVLMVEVVLEQQTLRSEATKTLPRK